MFGSKICFKVENEVEGQGQSNPKLIGILIVPRCIFGQNLEILMSIGGARSRGRAQNRVILDFEVKSNLEGQG